MKQEDINDLLSKHPSPESMIAFNEREKDAKSRGCACQSHPAFYDPQCAWDGHRK